MANPSEEPIVYPPCDDTPPYPHIADLEETIRAQRYDLARKEAAITELQLENANLRATAEIESDAVEQNARLGERLTAFYRVLDEMEEFCTVRPDTDDDPVTCGWRNAILRMREIRND